MNASAFWTPLLALVKSLSGVAVCQRDQDTQQFVPDHGARALCWISSTKDIAMSPGRSYVEAVPEDDGPVFERTTRLRTVVLRVRVESFSQLPDQEADDYTNKLRDCLESDGAYTSLGSIGLSFGEILFDNRLADEFVDGVAVSVAILDIRFLHRSTRTFALENERIIDAASQDIEGAPVQNWEP